MLTDDVNRYIALRRSLGYKLRDQAKNLISYANFADANAERFVSISTVIDWTGGARTPKHRKRLYGEITRFARFVAAEDPRHEVPRPGYYSAPSTRPVPYIYSDDEIALILDAASKLSRSWQTPNRPETYVMLFGLLAATGLRISEALKLTFRDISPNGTLHVRRTKFHKDRLVPLHTTVADALQRYMDLRAKTPVPGPYIFAESTGKQLRYHRARRAFAGIIEEHNIAVGRAIRPRMHDFRHTFATRTLEQTELVRGAIDRRAVALSTYLGHVEIANTYWYLQATPDLLRRVSESGEKLMVMEAVDAP